MKVLLFGATGMVGMGVLRECLLDPRVEKVVTVGRASTGQLHGKLGEVVHADLKNLGPVESELAGFDACFFCLGVSSAGMSEAEYRVITKDLTLSVATTLARLNPEMTFVYVSGTGTDSTEKGRTMWARVKGETENALFALPFKAKYMFRPGFIQPLHGIRSKTRLYRAIYAMFSPFYPLLKTAAPRWVTNTEAVGKAMIEVAASGSEKLHLENADINRLAGQG